VDLVPFVDAGDPLVTDKSFELSILDCLTGLQRALDMGWYQHEQFDSVEYERRYHLAEGDINWVVPGRLAALSSPVSPSMLSKHEGVRPQKVAEQLEKMKIKHLVRLNERLYREDSFTDAGILVHDLEFPDGSCPSIDII
jgi:cell division cycle 14